MATDEQGTPPVVAKQRRGFASMDQQKQQEIASRGGKAAHAKGTAHEYTSDEAREAGKKGGVKISRDRDHMAAIGRIGGENRGKRAKAKMEEAVHDAAQAALRAVGF